jgi:hypothetical protein
MAQCRNVCLGRHAFSPIEPIRVLVSAAPLFIRFADAFASAVDDRLRDKMLSVGTLPLLLNNAVVVPKLLFEVGNHQSES